MTHPSNKDVEMKYSVAFKKVSHDFLDCYTACNFVHTSVMMLINHNALMIFDIHATTIYVISKQIWPLSNLINMRKYGKYD